MPERVEQCADGEQNGELHFKLHGVKKRLVEFQPFQRPEVLIQALHLADGEEADEVKEVLRVHRHDEEHDDEGEEEQIEVKPGESLLPKDDCRQIHHARRRASC